MKILSTNLGKLTTFQWHGKEETTGIYKKPTDQALYLSKNDVLSDEIANRVNHGGYYKACYVFSAEQYPFWQALYPDLDWSWGMFGENLTVSDFDENTVYLGDIYQVGEAIVQVSQYREPCYKLGYKFNTQRVVKEFIEHGYGGSYLSILEEGYVKVGDAFTLLKREQETLSVAALFQLVFAKIKPSELLHIAANSRALPVKKRRMLQAHII
jgi:MOSC domain-containing protein YiiM